MHSKEWILSEDIEKKLLWVEEGTEAVKTGGEGIPGLVERLLSVIILGKDVGILHMG